MSLYAAGLNSARASSAGAFYDATPATDKWREQMEAAADKVRAKYSGPGPFTVYGVLTDLDKWWKVATQFAEQAPDAKMLPVHVTEAKNNAVNLLEARAELRTRPALDVVAPADVARFVALMVAPIAWLVAVGRPMLENVEAPASMLKTALWIAAAIGGVWGVSKLLDSASGFKREIVGTRPLVPPSKLVRNPPPWAVDAELYETARVAVRDSGEQYDNPKMVIVHVYKQLGGRVQ